ncbi:hypothetical protein MHBO_001066 [Bonamia ostreae]|uniref:Uncharacterized protein n=1 Tax=Bonamia ostreae TaxID=126728 RepID=A0ABV2AHM9_9EUKA
MSDQNPKKRCNDCPPGLTERFTNFVCNLPMFNNVCDRLRNKMEKTETKPIDSQKKFWDDNQEDTFNHLKFLAKMNERQIEKAFQSIDRLAETPKTRKTDDFGPKRTVDSFRAKESKIVSNDEADFRMNEETRTINGKTFHRKIVIENGKIITNESNFPDETDSSQNLDFFHHFNESFNDLLKRFFGE